MFKRLFESLTHSRRLDRISEEVSRNAHRLNHLAAQIDLLLRETRLLLGHMSLPPAEIWKGKPTWSDGAPGANVFPNSTICRQDSFEAPYFPYWTGKVGAALSYHRKLWEYVFICQALWERGAIRPDAKGLGFGVGREPLTAYFASEECDVVATDVAHDVAVEKGWSQTIQHAAGIDALRYDHICPSATFDRRVTFQVCDMNDVSGDLTGFDFCWSACALEHLGSLEHGLRFIERSLDCLKPGGWAVHTTEYNISSDATTVEQGATVLFRRSDLLVLAERLKTKGHIVAPFDFDPGLAPLDRYIDVPPYRPEPHLRLSIHGFAATSIGIIVQKMPNAS
jgi:hypothetical protein